MVNDMAEYIERGALWTDIMMLPHNGDIISSEDVEQLIKEAPTIDAVPVVSGYHKGDVCIYGYGAENKSRALVEIVRILNDERGVAEVKFLKVFVDDTGNGLFDYLLKSGKTMNASFQYLKNITSRMDGDS